MFRTIVFSAFGAGLAVCLAVSALQAFTTDPLIFHAEAFETSAPAETGAGIVHTHDDGTAHVHDETAWAPSDGIERTLSTAVTNLLVGFAVSLMLLGAMVIRGEPIDARRGLLWGVAGFAAVSLLPAFGLPPELPGTPAADIVDRQLWWLGTAFASAVGIALLVFGRDWRLMAAGAALLVVPHVIGAPQPPSHDVPYPGGLAGQFVMASVVVSALLWSLSGLTAGWLHQRFSRDA